MPTILIADDSHFHQALVTKALKDKGFQLLVAEDGVHATIIAQRVLPDVILLDLTMPGGSGVEVLKRLKRSAKTKTIPVIIVTANEDPAAKGVVTSLGASEFLQKPINPEELVEKISALLTFLIPQSRKRTRVRYRRRQFLRRNNLHWRVGQSIRDRGGRYCRMSRNKIASRYR